MKVSLLCPSRGRPQLLRKSIESLGKGDFEVLVGVDADDPTIQEIQDLRPIVFTEHYGYHRLHEYCNGLAKKAKGDWLFLWNDDATMETQGWLKAFEEFDPSEPLVLNFWHEIDNLFPAISRKLYEIQGHFSLQTHCDSWVQQVGERSGIQRFVPGVKIIHNKPTDETGQASTHAAMSHTGAEFGSPKFQDLINTDAAKVKDWLEKNGR